MFPALRRLALLVTGWVLVGMPATAQAPVGSTLHATPAAYVEFLSLITSEITRHRAAYADPGISMVLVDETGTSSSSSFGIADRDSGSLVDEATIFEMGSISKLFTCAAVLQLRERGLVDLDRPLRDYLPGFDALSRFPSGAESITVRMLMTHHSGLMMDDDPWETSVPERYFYRAVFEYIKDKPLLFPPGQKMRYSSFGANLLGLLVERRSGMEFSRYMREKLLLPLVMPNASFDVHDLTPSRLAKAYNYLPLWDLIPMEEIRPAGSLRAPVAEVAHFATMLLAGGEYQGRRLLSRESVAEMTRIQNRDNCLDGDARIALGFMARPTVIKTGAERELVVLYHFGQARTKSLFLIVPAWHKGLVVSCNDYGVTDASYDLFSKIWNRYLRALCAEEFQPYDYHQPIPDWADPAPCLNRDLAGAYASTHGLKVLEASADTLIAADGGTRFIPLVDGRFATEPWTFPRVLFRFEAEGALATIDGYPVDRWERLGPPDLPSALAGCAGIYEATGRPGLPPIELREAQGRLLLRPVRTPANENVPAREQTSGTWFPLRFTGSDSAEVVNGALSGYFGYRFVFERDAKGIKLLLVDGLGATLYRRLP